MFEAIGRNPHWEKLEVREKSSERLAAVIFDYMCCGCYKLMFIGISSSFTRSGVYRQALLASIDRAVQLGCRKVLMGFTAVAEKHNLGCVQVPTHAYLQAKEHFAMEYFENVATKGTIKVNI